MPFDGRIATRLGGVSVVARMVASMGSKQPARPMARVETTGEPRSGALTVAESASASRATTARAEKRRRLKRYKQAQRDLNESARRTTRSVALIVLAYPTLTIALAGVLREPFGLWTKQPAHLVARPYLTGLWSLVAVGPHGGLGYVMSLVIGEGAFAAALAVTKADPAASPHSAAATERLLNSLKGTVQILTSMVCLLALGLAISSIRARSELGPTVLALALAVSSFMLCLASVHQTDSKLDQIAVESQLDDLKKAKRNLNRLPPARTVRFFSLALTPVAIAFIAVTTAEGVEYGLEAATLVGFAFAYACGLLVVGLGFIRVCLAAHALTWAQRKPSTPRKAKLLAKGLVVLVAPSLVWLSVLLLLSWTLTSAHWWLFVPFAAALAWPIVCLIVLYLPVRRSASGGWLGLVIAPRGLAKAAALKQLRQRKRRLKAERKEVRKRVQSEPLFDHRGGPHEVS